MPEFYHPNGADQDAILGLARERVHPALEWYPHIYPDHLATLQAHGKRTGHVFVSDGVQAAACHSSCGPGGFWPLGTIAVFARGEYSRQTFRQAKRLGFEWVKLGARAYYRCR